MRPLLAITIFLFLCRAQNSLFDEEHKYPVDKILDVRRAACQSVGGVGDRYTCRIQGKESYLWFEKGRWFVAAKR